MGEIEVVNRCVRFLRVHFYGTPSGSSHVPD